MSVASNASAGDRTEPGVGVATRHMMASLEARLFGGATNMQLGRYELQNRVGAGAMGAVFRARDPKLSRTVAIKVINGSALGADRGDYVARLMKEAQALASLSHPNVVAVHDVGEEDGQVFIAMEYIAGVTLRRWLHDRAPPAGTARVRAGLALFEQAGRGLAAAHALGLVHRDFKPDNVLVGDDGRVRVVDFGLAAGRPLGDDDGRGETTPELVLEASGTATRSGQLLGTPAYMSPEQFAGSQVGPTADQWAFCVSLYELCYGERPFSGSTIEALATAIDSAPPTLPDGVGVPSALRSLIRRGLEQSPDARWPDMEALLAALHRLRAGPRRRITIALVLGGTAIGAAASWAATPAKGETPCADASEALDEVWSDDTRDRLRRALEASSRPYAKRSADTLVEALDDYGTRWRNARVKACEDARATLGESQSLTDRRMACLARSLREVRARLDVWLEGGDVVVDQATLLARDLPGVTQCESTDRLVAMTPPPDDPEARDLYDRVDEAVPRAAALTSAARYDEALALLEPLAPEVETSKDAVTTARWWEARSQLALRVGDTETFRHAAKSALLAAVRSGDDRAAAGAATQLANAQSLRKRSSEARDWAELAVGYAQRVGAQATEANARGVLATSLAQQGDTKGARQQFQRALAAADAADLPMLGVRLRSEQAATLVQLGELERAAETYREAMVETAATLGDDHPNVTHERLNMAAVLLMMGRADEAEPELRAGIAHWRSVFGPDYPKLTTHLGNLAGVHTRRGELAQALEIAREVLRIARVHEGEESAQTVSARRLVAGLLADTGETEAARRETEALITSARHVFADDPAALAQALLSAAHAHARFEEWEEGLALLAEARSQHGRLEDPPVMVQWQILNLQGYLEIQRGAPDAAVEPARRAIEIAIAAKLDPARIGHTQLNLATAQFEGGSPDSALATIEQAIPTLEEHGDFSKGDLDKARRLRAKAQAAGG